MFGGARILNLVAKLGRKNETQRKNLPMRSIMMKRKFAQVCSEYSKTSDYKEMVVVTGGGPGVMEAGIEVRKMSARHPLASILLPHEQAPNEYVSQSYA